MAEPRRATSMSARETPTARMGATTSMNIVTLEATDEDSAVRAWTPPSALCRAVHILYQLVMQTSLLVTCCVTFVLLPTRLRRGDARGERGLERDRDELLDAHDGVHEREEVDEAHGLGRVGRVEAVEQIAEDDELRRLI